MQLLKCLLGTMAFPAKSCVYAVRHSTQEKGSKGPCPDHHGQYLVLHGDQRWGEPTEQTCNETLRCINICPQTDEQIPDRKTNHNDPERVRSERD